MQILNTYLGRLDNFSTYISFSVRNEVDCEDGSEGEPGWVELIEKKVSTVRTQCLVVQVHDDLVLGVDHGVHGVDGEVGVFLF